MVMYLMNDTRFLTICDYHQTWSDRPDLTKFGDPKFDYHGKVRPGRSDLDVITVFYPAKD